ncbi:UNVERIFIED_ORG: hypothetical protein HNP28_001823 [Comamonas terrigena]
MRLFPSCLLHGSPKNSLARLCATYSDESAPFGPAIYLTEDPEVASCYAKGTGVIYAVQLAGNSELTISMNAPWKNLSVDARLAITKLFKVANAPFPANTDNARAIIDSVIPAMCIRKRNEFLAAQGIWMLYGYIDAVEQSGLCGSGVQYAVLSESVIESQGVWEASRFVG